MISEDRLKWPFTATRHFPGPISSASDAMRMAKGVAKINRPSEVRLLQEV